MRAKMKKPTIYTASLEAVAYVLRLHPSRKGYGSPYVAATTVTVDETGTATIRGLAMRRFTKSSWKAISNAFSTAGVKAATWTRLVDGKKRVVRVRVPPPNEIEGHVIDSSHSEDDAVTGRKAIAGE